MVFDPPFVDLSLPATRKGLWAGDRTVPGHAELPGPRSCWLSRPTVRRLSRRRVDLWNAVALRAALLATGEGLSHALDVRSRAAQWLATERFPDWEFFFAVAGELHSGMEGLWHGVDASHPLNTHPSAAAAAAALFDIHRALDRMVGLLVKAAGDAVVIAFNMGGAGPNNCDAQSMVCSPNCSTDTPSVTRCSRSLGMDRIPEPLAYLGEQETGMRRARRGFPNRPANLSPRRWRRICAQSLIASRNR